MSADAGAAPAVVATTHERGLQPLCARYEPAALDLLTGFDPAGRVITQVQELGPLHLAVDPDLLRNINSADDLAAAEAELSRR